jgi:Protein of unknown function (DUF2510)
MSEVPPSATPPAGWYPDPAEPSVLRFWNGAQWTTDMQPAYQPGSDIPQSRLSNRAALGIVFALAVVATLAFVVLGGGGDSASGGAGGLSAAQVQEADAQAQAQARTAQTAIETYSTDHAGQYAGASAEALEQVEPTLADAPLTLEALPEGYTVTVASESGTSFSIVRDPAGAATLTCDAPGVGNCPESGDWATG